MADIFDTSQRSQIMARVKSKNTAPEVNIRKKLYARGLRYRLHDKRLPGTPDLVFYKYKAVIFIHGCFWHQHNCKAAKLPASNKEFWENKLHGNYVRDIKHNKELQNLGWRVKIIWSCQLKNKVMFKNEDDVNEIYHWITTPTAA